MREIKMILSLLGDEEKRSFSLLLLFNLLTGFAQLIGVGSVVPFMAFIAKPELAQDNGVIGAAYRNLGFETTQSFQLFLGAAMLVSLALSNILAARTFYLTNKLSEEIQHILSSRLLKAYLGRQYSWHLDRNSSELAKNIVAEVRVVTSGFLLPFTQALIRGTTALFLVGLIFAVDPLVALSSMAVLTTVYFLIYSFLRRVLSKLGAERLEADRLKYKATLEALGAIKIVKLYNKERSLLERYQYASGLGRDLKTSISWITSAPRFLMETLAFGGIIGIILHLIYKETEVARLLPLLSLYAVSGLRLLPALQAAYSAISTLRVSAPAVEVLYEEILSAEKDAENFGSCYERLPFETAIKLEDVGFSYNNGDKRILEKISLQIPKNRLVAFAGSTGAGKTTIVDLVMGVLEPTQGRIFVDGTAVDKKNIGRWQANIGYVPQDIFLTDDTIANNIAFGCNPDEIDYAKVTEAARIANIHNFIARELPGSYDTVIGERGVRLSGGQRQRLGIARALYLEPSVLILDEATSALDGATESAVMEAIDSLSGSKTIILIAHRLDTLKNCDMIFFLDRRIVAAKGTYQELVKNNAKFRSFQLHKD